MCTRRFFVNGFVCVVLLSIVSEIPSLKAAAAAMVNDAHQMSVLSSFRKNRHPIVVGEGRIFYDALSSFISSSEWFPLELNVPDTIASVADGVSSLWTTMMAAIGQSENLPRIVLRTLESIL